MNSSLLQGIRVLDFSRVLAGPYCTAMLADLGAEVIKVEPPGGDDQRYMGRMVDGESTNFVLNNRGKRSICLDMKSPEGRKLAHELVAHCDIVVENFKPGVAARLGIGYNDLKAIKSDIVYCSISGFGQHGPDSSRASYDVVAQAMSGIMSVTGEPDGPPTLIGESIGDICAGMFASWAIMAALFDRQRNGNGRYVDVAMFDSLLAIQPTALAQYMFGGTVPKRVGNRHPMSSPFGAYAAMDGHFVVAAANDKLFQAVANVIGQPNLPSDARFASDSARSQNDGLLRPFIEAWSRSISVDEVVRTFTQVGVPAAPIQNIEQALLSEQSAARTILTELKHPVLGDFAVVQQPVHFSDMQRNQTSAAPMLGEHSEAILTSVLDMPAERVKALRDSGVI